MEPGEHSQLSRHEVVSGRPPLAPWRIAYWLTAAAAVSWLTSVYLQPIGVEAAGENYREKRERLVREDIEREGVKNPRVLEAIRTVQRHEFVAPELRNQAYFDVSLPIGFQQTISSPFIVAYMTEIIDPQPEEKVLEIGTGSGYQAAVLGELCREVYTIEIVEQLGASAAERLKRLKYANVYCKVGDGYQGWPSKAPFDKIIVTCSPESVPQPLIDQLKDGGKLLIPLGERYEQAFYLFEKRDGELKSTELIPTCFVPMTGTSEENRQVLPDPLNPRLKNVSFEDDANGDGLADAWYYQRQCTREENRGADGQWVMKFENDQPDRMSQALQALPFDGKKLGSVSVSSLVRYRKTRPGTDQHEKPGVFIQCYDQHRKMIAMVLGSPACLGNQDRWERVTKTVAIPAATRELIIRVGLNGGTGEFWIDDVKLTAKPR